MSHITNEDLVLEAIRRTRKKKKPDPKNGEIVWSDLSRTIHLLKGWLTPAMRKQTIQRLIQQRVIQVRYHRYKRTVVKDKDGGSVTGVINSYPESLPPNKLLGFSTSSHGRLLLKPEDADGLKSYYQFYGKTIAIRSDLSLQQKSIGYIDLWSCARQ